MRDTTCPRPGQIALYRFYDADDGLLYVGFSNEPWRRRKEHSVTQPWYPRVRHQAITWYDSEAEARGAETRAIKSERPEFNVAGAVAPVRPEPEVIVPQPMPARPRVRIKSRTVVGAAWWLLAALIPLSAAAFLGAVTAVVPARVAQVLVCLVALIGAPLVAFVGLVELVPQWMRGFGAWTDRACAYFASGGSL